MNKAVYCLLGPTQFEEEMGSMHKYGSTMGLMQAEKKRGTGRHVEDESVMQTIDLQENTQTDTKHAEWSRRWNQHENWNKRYMPPRPRLNHTWTNGVEAGRDPWYTFDNQTNPSQDTDHTSLDPPSLTFPHLQMRTYMRN